MCVDVDKRGAARERGGERTRKSTQKQPTHRYLRFHSMMEMQREQQPDVAGMAAMLAVFLELGWCLKAKEFWCRGSGPFAPCVRGP